MRIRTTLLKLTNNLSSLNEKEIIKFLRFYFYVFSLVLLLVENIYEAFNTMCDDISKHFKVRQKRSAARSKSVFGNVMNTVFRV